MEKLTKQQIVLVTLLVSFVTSIATGIVTVALMDQAPAGVTQTINRVVERTIERVVTEPAKNNNTAAVVTKETIIVSEDDKIVESIDKNKESVVRIYTDSESAGDVIQKMFIGLGTIVSKDGLIATGDIFADPAGKYLISQDNINFYRVKVLPKKDVNKFYFLKVVQDDKKPISFVPVIFSDSDNLRLGQTIIAIGGQMQNSVSTGIVSSLVDMNGKNASTNDSATSTQTSAIVTGINTNINLFDIIPGGPLLSLSGDIVGIRISKNISDSYSFLSANTLRREMDDVATI